jgi:class 3 adenylate cyclase
VEGAAIVAGSAREGQPSPGGPTAPGPARSGRRRLSGISLASRLAATVLLVGSGSLTVATIVGLNAGHSLGERIVHDSLELERSAGTEDVLAQAEFYERLAGQWAAGPVAAAAVEEFSEAIEELYATPRPTTRAQRQELIEAYGPKYIEPLRANGETVQLSDVVASDPAAVYLQAAYSLPEAPITHPIAVDDADDGSTWSEVHARVHPTFRNGVLQAGLVDVYLIEADTQRIVYSASKGPDLGTSLLVGPYGGSIVSRAAAAAADRGATVLTDLEFYRGSPGTPIGAAAAPILDGDELLGVVVVTYDAAVYTELLRDLHNATFEATEAGDLYLIGGDGRTRSDPQAFLADPAGFVEASEAAGQLSPAAAAEIERNGTTVLVQPAADETVGHALEGQTEMLTGVSMTGTEVIGAVYQVPLDDVAWYTVAEVDSATADATIASFRSVLLVGATVFVVALAFVAVAWARQVMRPVRVISDRLGRTALARATAAPFEPLSIPDRSPLELHKLADSFMAMELALRRQQAVLRQARAERLGVLERMLPSSIAQRIARGDIESLDQVPSATVAVVVVRGLAALVEKAGTANDRGLLDGLLAEIDDIALDHGVERIKVLGDSYFAACGHDRPYLDHAPRVVAFAKQVAEVVRVRSRESALDTSIGINTGSVTVGLAAGARVVYDVWGPTVTAAHDLSRVAGPGEIVLTDATRARLPEEIRLSPRDAAEGLAGGSPGGLWSVVVAEDSGHVPAGAEGSA